MQPQQEIDKLNEELQELVKAMSSEVDPRNPRNYKALKEQFQTSARRLIELIDQETLQSTRARLRDAQDRWFAAEAQRSVAARALQDIQRLNRLSAEEQQELAQRLRDKGKPSDNPDLQAAVRGGMIYAQAAEMADGALQKLSSFYP